MAAAAKSSPQLSSNTLNALFKTFDYAKCFDLVETHFQANHDVVSVSKFLNALAFHAYYNPIPYDKSIGPSSTVGDKVIELLGTCFRVLVEGEAVAVEVRDKILTSANNVLMKRFLKDGAWSFVKRMSEVLQLYVSHLKLPDQVDFLDAFRDYAAAAEKFQTLCPEMSKDAKASGTDGRFVSGKYVFRTILARYKICELRLFLISKKPKVAAKIGVSDFKDLFANLCRLTLALPTEDVALYSGWQDRILSLGARYAIHWTSNSSSESQSLLEACVTHYQNVSKTEPRFFTGIGALITFSQLSDCHDRANRRDEVLSVLGQQRAALDQVLLLKDNLAQAKLTRFQLNIFLAHNAFQTFRVTCDKSIKAVEVELIKNKKLLERLTISSKKASSNGEDDEKGEAGDLNPYTVGLTQHDEAEKRSSLLNILDLYEKAFDPSTSGDDKKCLQGTYISGRACGRALGWTSEFLGMLGYESDKKRAINILITVCQEFKLAEYECIALKELVSLEGDKLSDAHRQRIATLLTKDNTQLYSLNLSLALADLHLRTGSAPKCVKLCNKILKRAESTDYVLRTEVHLLISRAFCALSYSQITSLNCDTIVAKGPLEAVYEAFKWVSHADQYMGKYRMWNHDLTYNAMRETRLRYEILNLRIKLSQWAGLSREMRLFGKMSLEQIQALSLPSRAALALLNTIEVDLFCDEIAQAELKFFAVEAILRKDTLDTEDEEKKRQPKEKNREGVDQVGASPALHRKAMSVPRWLEKHEPGKCVCANCSQPLLLSVIVKYVNFKGVVHHHQKDLQAAASYFSGALKVIRLVSRRLHFLEDKKQKTDLKFVLLEALQAQIESYGKDEFLTKCHELLELQRRILLRLGPEATASKAMGTIQFAEALMSTQVPESELNISGLELGLDNLKLSPKQLLKPSKKSDDADEQKTPVPTTKRRIMPRRPTKKILAV